MIIKISIQPGISSQIAMAMVNNLTPLIPIMQPNQYPFVESNGLMAKMHMSKAENVFIEVSRIANNA